MGRTISPSCHGSSNQLRSAELFRAGGNGQRMQTLEILVVAKRLRNYRAGQDVECTGLQIDYRRWRYAYLGQDERTLYGARGNRRLILLFVQQADLPER